MGVLAALLFFTMVGSGIADIATDGKVYEKGVCQLAEQSPIPGARARACVNDWAHIERVTR